MAERSAVNRQVLGSIPSGGVLLFYFFLPRALSDPLRNVVNEELKYRHTFSLQPCYAEVSSDRTNLSPFTKDYRGLALQCD